MYEPIQAGRLAQPCHFHEIRESANVRRDGERFHECVGTESQGKKKADVKRARKCHHRKRYDPMCIPHAPDLDPQFELVLNLVIMGKKIVVPILTLE